MKVQVRDGEHIDRAMRRFKRKIEQSGILKEVKKRRYFLKPSIDKRLKSRAASSRNRKQEKRQSQGI